MSSVSVANSSYNEYTKFSLKIYQIYTKFIVAENFKLTAVFPCFFMISQLAVEQCHHREAASSISTFLTSAETDLLAPGKFNLPTPATAFSLNFCGSVIHILCK